MGEASREHQKAKEERNHLRVTEKQALHLKCKKLSVGKVWRDEA